jgi:hypothetical protein
VRLASKNLKDLSDTLYEQYGRPLEAQHRGEYVAIAPDGRTVLAPTVLDVVEKAANALGTGVFVFKIGDKVVWKWR